MIRLVVRRRRDSAERRLALERPESRFIGHGEQHKCSRDFVPRPVDRRVPRRELAERVRRLHGLLSRRQITPCHEVELASHHAPSRKLDSMPALPPPPSRAASARGTMAPPAAAEGHTNPALSPRSQRPISPASAAIPSE